jgi:hypothetical protein
MSLLLAGYLPASGSGFKNLYAERWLPLVSPAVPDMAVPFALV